MEHSSKHYTAGFQCDGRVNFDKALTRPVIGTWETLDYQQDVTFRPSDGRTLGPDGRPLSAGCTGFGG
jgi:hypothetical protein